MKKITIGYIYSGQNLTSEEIIALELIKKKNIELVMFNISKSLDMKKIVNEIKKCDLFYNSTGEDSSIELVKIIEKIGKKVVDSSDCYYNSEDKWRFFLKCKENKIPAPETILLSENIKTVKKELKEFNHWPVIIKRVIGTMGEYVEKADNIEQAEEIIKKFREQKGKDKKDNMSNTPIIAQEFIKSHSYRVTVIDNKILQTAIKKSNSWKSTGVYGKKFEKFIVDDELKKLVDKIINLTKINICGLDFLKKDNKWIALEVNSAPAFDFFKDEEEKLVEAALDCVVAQIK